ncbi:hypothetical protein D1007_02773 [Hordeum vulgare]|nr:hypothetical protein D1007_02773 [Hordeum vulgare]
MAARPSRDDGDRCQMCCFLGIVAFVFLSLGYCIYGIATLSPPPWYSVAVAAVSGLDPATDLRSAPHALDPAFNLTFRIDATLSAQDEAPYCLDRGTSVKVSYLRVPLAVGRAPEPGEGT